MSLFDRIAHLHLRSCALNEATDRMNEAIERVENALVSTKLGMSGGVPLDEGTNKLWFGKSGDHWGLFIVDLNMNATPLRNTSRATRVGACAKLDALLEELLVRADQELAAVEGAFAVYEKFAAATRVVEET